jgi:hypothetical protein
MQSYYIRLTLRFRYPHFFSSANDNASMQLLNSVLASVALAQAASAFNQGPGVGAPSPGMAPPPAQPRSAQAPSLAATSTPAAAAPSHHGIAATLMANPRAQATFLQQVAQAPPAQPMPNASTPAVVATSVIPKAAADPPQPSRVSQLKAAYAEQQEALRLAYEKTLKEHEEQEKKEKQAPTPISSPKAQGSSSSVAAAPAAQSEKLISPAEQLQRSYEAHLASLQQTEKQKPSAMGRLSASSVSTPRTGQTNDRKVKKMKKKKTGSKKGQRQPEDGKSKEEEAGVLLGFLNSLRSSYDDAAGEDADQPRIAAEAAAVVAAAAAAKIRPKKSSGEGEKSIVTSSKRQNKKPGKSVLIASKKPSDPSGAGKRQRDADRPSNAPDQQRMKNASITAMMHSNQNKLKPVSESSSNNSSSQPSTEQSSSSIEDSTSDKTESGDESAEDEEAPNKRTASAATTTTPNKGPPRKRLKTMQQESNEFTTANLLEHSKRMDREY